MGKRKRDASTNQFKECIDPRFSGMFKSGSTEKNKNPLNNALENVSQPVYQNDNSGFQTYVSAKLSDYLDKNIKEVDRPVVENDIFRNKIEGIHLFSESNMITELQLPIESVIKKPKKKKRNKDKSCKNESLKDVIVTVDWIKRQAQILNS